MKLLTLCVIAVFVSGMAFHEVRAGEKKVNVTLTEATSSSLGMRLLFIDIGDSNIKRDVMRQLSWIFPLQVQPQGSDNSLNGPIIITANSDSNKGIFKHSRACPDILIGSVLCGAACIPPLRAIKKHDAGATGAPTCNPTLSTQAGCLVTILTIGGVVFLAKGIRELLMKDEKPQKGSYFQTDEIIGHASLGSVKREMFFIDTKEVCERIVGEIHRFNSDDRALVYDALLTGRPIPATHFH